MELSAPYLLIGLGNFGHQYNKSRHNAGFCCIDAMTALHTPESTEQKPHYTLHKLRIAGVVYYLVKPLTYMNLSGQCLSAVFRKTGLSLTNMMVICDDLDLPLSRLRLKLQGGAGGQKGMRNIIDQMNTNVIPRLQIGIGRPPRGEDIANYVLSRFAPDEEPLFLASCVTAAQHLSALHTLPLAELQKRINTRD
jgi:PTH1 family peptidyl-tRNA hydrolase